MGIHKALVVVGLSGLLGGCVSYSPSKLADPPKITLTAALTDVIDALNAANARLEQYKKRIGLNPCTVTAAFNVAAKATYGGKMILRGVSVCLNRFRAFFKWISASVMLPPLRVPAG